MTKVKVSIAEIGKNRDSKELEDFINSSLLNHLKEKKIIGISQVIVPVDKDRHNLYTTVLYE